MAIYRFYKKCLVSVVSDSNKSSRFKSKKEKGDLLKHVLILLSKKTTKYLSKFSVQMSVVFFCQFVLICEKKAKSLHSAPSIPKSMVFNFNL